MTPAAVVGGSWLQPTDVRVEPGDTVTLSGEVGKGQLGWVNDGPFFAYLVGDGYGSILASGFGGTKTDVPLGELEIAAAGNYARVTIDITIPAEAPHGEYLISACNEPCTQGFGDLIGSFLYVGVDPPDDSTLSAPTGTAPTTYLALAPYPERSTGLEVGWIAISAGLGVVVLGAIVTTRHRSGRR